MSTIILKLKANNTSAGTTISGKGPAGDWINRGPYGLCNNVQPTSFGATGFSLNGGHRNKGSVGVTTSSSGTPFKGIHPKGSGGTRGRYVRPPPVMNLCEGSAQTSGTQAAYIKPSTISTSTMLRQKYKGIYTGSYPHNWVQPNYTGPLTDNKSQGMYIRDRAIDYMRVRDPNFDFQRSGGARISMSDVMAQKQFKCIDQTNLQKPFPFGTNGNTCNGSRYYLTPPAWYIAPNTA